MKKIIMHPIGIIHSPYKESKDIPIQGRFKDDVEAFLELEFKYVKGLKDLDKFSHAILIYYLHKSDKTRFEYTFTGKKSIYLMYHRGIFFLPNESCDSLFL